ncbi:PilN domain-containing protein [Candidatus Microgenomates bacterium]|nr:PilN domain-containing protein [Candidatus Microgenomates bacterium]
MLKSGPKLDIHLDLLKPQGSPQKLPEKFLRWLLSTGRFIFVLVEAVVLLAFIFRFKLDADIASTKEKIDEQIPYVESLRNYEILIKQIQLKLSTIGAFNQNYADYPEILKRISDQVPSGIKINTMGLQKDVGKITIRINAQAQSNNDLLTFLLGMREDQYFTDVSLVSVGLEQGIIRFILNASAKVSRKGEKST